MSCAEDADTCRMIYLTYSKNVLHVCVYVHICLSFSLMNAINDNLAKYTFVTLFKSKMSLCFDLTKKNSEKELSQVCQGG